jgi:Domain of unknown function (DUF4132)
VKRPSERAVVDKAMVTLSAASGLSVEALAEQAVPTFGLDHAGHLDVPAAGCMARLTLDRPTAATLTWLSAKGTRLKAAPKPSSAKHTLEIASVKALLQDLNDTLKAHAARLERVYLTTHTWPLAAWSDIYAANPVLRHLACGLVWTLVSTGKMQSGLWRNGNFENADGVRLDVAADATVHLWHPIHAAPADVLAWRKRIIALGLTQPFKQVYREVYLVTDAERRTELYSNRFAAHILRQSQFRALGKAREWSVPLEGAWDPGHAGPAHRKLPSHGLRAEFLTGGVDGDLGGDGGTYGAYALVASDRIRFINERNDAVHIDDVPPIVFSEVMRDVDLFVGVASVGNDPNWVDQGPNHPLSVYWQNTALGDISGSAATRKAVLQDILPMLSIANQCHIEDRWLIVDGRGATYRIHLGSGTVQMGTTYQYLCIVPAQKAAPAVRLPFEGDGMLSIILSKALLLAEDHKITDRSILSQIAR